MEPRISLLCSQQPAIHLYFEPEKFRPLPTHPSSVRLILKLFIRPLCMIHDRCISRLCTVMIPT